MTAWVSAHPGVATAIALLVILPLVYRALAKFAWPMQQRLADDIAWLWARNDLSDETRDLVAFMRKHAFDGFAMMAFSIALPFALVLDIFKAGAGQADPLSGYPTDVQQVLDRAIHRFVFSVAAVNPLFAVLFAVELLCAMTVTALLGLIRLTTARPMQGVEAGVREALTIYDRNLTRFT